MIFNGNYITVVLYFILYIFYIIINKIFTVKFYFSFSFYPYNVIKPTFNLSDMQDTFLLQLIARNKNFYFISCVCMLSISYQDRIFIKHFLKVHVKKFFKFIRYKVLLKIEFWSNLKRYNFKASDCNCYCITSKEAL